MTNGKFSFSSHLLRNQGNQIRSGIILIFKVLPADKTLSRASPELQPKLHLQQKVLWGDVFKWSIKLPLLAELALVSMSQLNTSNSGGQYHLWEIEHSLNQLGLQVLTCITLYATVFVSWLWPLCAHINSLPHQIPYQCRELLKSSLTFAMLRWMERGKNSPNLYVIIFNKSTFIWYIL